MFFKWGSEQFSRRRLPPSKADRAEAVRVEVGASQVVVAVDISILVSSIVGTVAVAIVAPKIVVTISASIASTWESRLASILTVRITGIVLLSQTTEQPR